MNRTLGNNIARLRKEKGMTQDELARELNISFQAVSKWENGISSPDIVNIKHLAEIFGVSIDRLFGMELEPEGKELPFMPDAPEDHAAQAADSGEAESADAPEGAEAFFESGTSFGGSFELPWADDGTLRAVLFRGRELLGAEDVPRALLGRQVKLEYKGDPLNVFSFFDVSCGSVQGNVQAGGDVDCESVGGSVSAGGDVDCERVGTSVSCGGDADCEEVGGNVQAGGDVDCGSVIGSVSAGDDVSCGNVGGDIRAGGDVNCDNVKGDVTAQGDVNCDVVGGRVNKL